MKRVLLPLVLAAAVKVANDTTKPEQSAERNPAPPEPSLSARAKGREGEVRARLLNPSPRFRWEADEPELRKQLLIILTRLSEVRRLLRQHEGRTTLPPAEEEDLGRVLDTEVAAYAEQLDTATDYADLLERMLVSLGGPVYVHTLLLNEACRDDLGEELPWRHFFPRAELDDLLAACDPSQAAPSDAAHARAVDRLSFLLGKRGHIHHRHARARSQLKNVFLKRLAIVLSVLIVLLGLAVYGNEGKKGVLLAGTAAAAGALGSALTGVLKVRDELSRIGELRLFGNALIVQPLVGASAGLLLFMLLTAGLPGVGSVQVQTAPWATFATYAFVAGFSEPFFLGVVQRLASAGDRKADKS